MKIEQRIQSDSADWRLVTDGLGGLRPQLAFAFGGRRLLEDPAILSQVRKWYPNVRVVFGSTAGEICDTSVAEDTIVVTAMSLEKSSVVCAAISVRSQLESRTAGRELARRFSRAGLVHVFVVCDGQLVNGTELSRGFNECLPEGVTLTGGLAGDGARFERTLVGLDEAPCSGRIAAVGFYGRHLRIGFGSCGGWEAFGEEHTVTRADGNILFALDQQPALRLYKEYLGEHVSGLPASALRFPLFVTPPGENSGVVRTILSVEDVTQSMVFAGDVPPGSRVQFMRASHEALVNGAAVAAEQSRFDGAAELAICVSCVGRRIVLGDHTGEEAEKVRRILGPGPAIAGFYSYGELAPAGVNVGCQLHNQTMTITTLREV